MRAYHLGSSVCLFVHGADMLVYAFEHNAPSIAAFTSHHPHRHPPPPGPPGCVFIYICEELKSLPKAIWQRGDPSSQAKGKQRRSAGQPRALLASEKTMVAELLSPFLFHHIACTRANGLFLSPFFLPPFGSVVDRWENITYFLFGKKTGLGQSCKK